MTPQIAPHPDFFKWFFCSVVLWKSPLPAIFFKFIKKIRVLIGLQDFEDESDAKIVSGPDSETGQQSSPRILLEMPRQLMQGNAERVHVESNSGTTSVSHCDQSFPQYYYNCNVQVHNYYSSRWLKLKRFPNFLTKVVSSSFRRRSLISTR